MLYYLKKFLQKNELYEVTMLIPSNKKLNFELEQISRSSIYPELIPSDKKLNFELEQISRSSIYSEQLLWQRLTIIN